MQTVPPAARLTQAGIRRRVLIWQIVIFGATIAAITTMNIFTGLADHAREGVMLQWWEPVVCECSSAVLIALLIPAIARLYQRAPIDSRTWRWAIPLHLAATVPFSLVHVGGMVALRKLGYAFMGEHYRFAPWISGWVYEYRKDVVTYLLILAGLHAFCIYRMWLEGHLTPAAAMAAAVPVTVPPIPEPANPEPAAPVERLVVKKLNREFILNTTDIDRIDADGNYVTIHAQGQTWPLRESMAALERKLDSKHFARVHRRHIVNLDRIREIQPWDSGDYRIMLADGSFVNFSRRYRSRLPQLFN